MGRFLGLSGQRGQALPMVIVIMVVFGVIVVAVVEVTGGVGRDAKRENAHDSARSVAEAGIANGLSVLANAPRPLDPSALPSSASPQVDTVNGNPVSWFGSLSGDTWTITAKGTVANPAGGGLLRRTVRVDARVGSTAMNPAWNYVYANGGGCLSLDNSVVLAEPVYTRGNLCLDNSSMVTGSPVHVEGHIDTASSASVGASGTPIAELHVGTGCRYNGAGSYIFPCTPAQQVYATAADQVPAGVKKPPVDLAYWYANAKPGPMAACNGAGTPFAGGFDGDGTLNRSRADVNLFASDYDCTVMAGGVQVGRIAYTAGNPGSFVIDGTVFFDGNIVGGGSEQVLYSGRGTIYASGTIDLQGSQQICGAWSAGCDFTNWQPVTAMLVLVAGSATASPGFSLGQSMQFQGGIYAVGDYTQGSSVKAQGPKIADSMTISGSSQAAFSPYTYLPPGAPMELPIVTSNGWG
ncbi:MAG: hypothetical protein ACXWYS_03185 [Gaiellaceae bacterium]